MLGKEISFMLLLFNEIIKNVFDTKLMEALNYICGFYY